MKNKKCVTPNLSQSAGIYYQELKLSWALIKTLMSLIFDVSISLFVGE